ncbi:MAG TPA: Asp-tRNA(Asn)/Glu-tRNA(Gln) amidotransferase subunit GatC, partial [Parachlamydiales bacterium]|nr:Asp-tRNA(Asn)/Glu-tRNA(Gln) amidotransferase subunit GatC [Parachlamydiales bacterium]
GVAPCNHVLPQLKNVLREDRAQETLSREEFLKNAPQHIGGMIRVPPVIRMEE